MTAIVGYTDGKNTWLGGDSAGSNGYSIEANSQPKIFAVRNAIFGYTTSFRMGQLLEHHLKLSERAKPEISHIIQKIIPKIRRIFKANGYTHLKDSVESGGNFLVGIGGCLFEVQSDFSVLQGVRKYNAVGSGGEAALGAMFAVDRSPKITLLVGLKSAAEHQAGVCPPFHIIKTGWKKPRVLE